MTISQRIRAIAALLRFYETGDSADYYTAARALIAYSAHRLTDRNLIAEYVLRSMLEEDLLPDIENLRDFLRRDVKCIYTALLAVDWDQLFREKGFCRSAKWARSGFIPGFPAMCDRWRA